MMNKRLKNYFKEPNRNGSSYYTKLMRFHIDNSHKCLFWNKYSFRQKVITSAVHIVVIAPLVCCCSIYFLIFQCNTLLIIVCILIFSVGVGGVLTVLLRHRYDNLRCHYDSFVYQKYYQYECGGKEFDVVSNDEILKAHFIKLCNDYSISINKKNLKEIREVVEHYRNRNTWRPNIFPQFVLMLLSAIIAVLLTSGVSWLNANVTTASYFWSIVIRIIIMIVGFCIIIGQFVGGMEKKWWLSNRRQYHITLETVEQLIIESKE